MLSHRQKGILTDSSEDESVDGSDEEFHKAKRLMTSAPKCLDAQGGHKQDDNWVKTQHSHLQQRPGKRVNNIWGNVLAEQSVSKSVDKLNTTGSIDYNERGEESYDWTRSKLDPRHEIKDDSDSDSSQTSDASSAENIDDTTDLGQIETFAAAIIKPKPLKSRKSSNGRFDKNFRETDMDTNVDQRKTSPVYADQDVEKLKQRQARFGDWNKKDSEISENPKQHSHGDTKTDGTPRAAGEVKSRKRPHKPITKRFHHQPMYAAKEEMEVEVKPMKFGIEVNESMEPAVLANSLIDALREPQDKIYMFRKFSTKLHIVCKKINVLLCFYITTYACEHVYHFQTLIKRLCLELLEELMFILVRFTYIRVCICMFMYMCFLCVL